MNLERKTVKQLLRVLVIGAVATGMLVALGLSGCGGSSASSSAKKDISGSVTIVGSTALQPLVEAAGEQYGQQNKNVQITVQGGGSGQGITQIAAGSVQIGNSDVFAETKLKDTSALSKIKDNRVAVVGMGPVVNSSVAIDNISMENLKGIFTGKITNWKEIGGADEPITVINRAAGSGTRATFESAVLGGEQAPSTFKPQEQDSSGTVAKMVAETPGSISYLAFSYFDNSKFKTLSVDNIKPSAENVETNSWKIWSYEHMYTSASPDTATQSFIDYMMSDDVQGSLVSKNGYIAIKSMKVEKDASGAIKNL
jgi:phosphate transport system substrate-binding protein